jgi:dTDP-4-dehydrorhamnose 3,5-epimerase
LERRCDERGYFARTWCVNEFRTAGLDDRIAQCSVAVNERAGTLRGMHYQVPPFAEVKLVRCCRGAIYDVIVDLRPDSPTNAQWIALELRAGDGRMLYVPEGFAHGYQTLADDTEVAYQVSVPHAPDAARGFRWDDPLFGIEWPEVDARVISERDRCWPDYVPDAA